MHLSVFVQFTYLKLFLSRWHCPGAKSCAAEGQFRPAESQDVTLQTTTAQAALQTG